ncbi:MAG TPA: VF530 family protein [Polyangiales bacterium]
MTDQPFRDPLHGVTLQTMLERLVELYGFPKLGLLIPIRCFQYDASINSSLKFLRRTPWARTKLEQLYVANADKWPPS